MLLDGHNLDGVVAVGDNARQHVHAEFLIGAHTLAVLCHADMALVDEQRLGVRHEVGDFELIRLLRVPHLGREDIGLVVLDNTGGVSRDALAFPALPVHTQFVQVAMTHGTRGKRDFPVAALETFQAIRGTLTPIVELADEINLGSIGSPLAEHPTTISSAVQAIVVVGIGKLHEVSRAAGKFGNLVHSVLMAPVDGVAVRLQPGVIVDNRKILFLPHNRSIL